MLSHKILLCFLQYSFFILSFSGSLCTFLTIATVSFVCFYSFLFFLFLFPYLLCGWILLQTEVQLSFLYEQFTDLYLTQVSLVTPKYQNWHLLLLLYHPVNTQLLILRWYVCLSWYIQHWGQYPVTFSLIAPLEYILLYLYVHSTAIY